MGCFALPRSLAHGRHCSRPLGFPVRRPPSAPARLHALDDILPIVTLAVICGADRGPAVEFFGRRKRARLAMFLELSHGIPPHDTFGCVFARLDPEQLEACFTRWLQSLAAVLRDQVVSVDGNTARRSHNAPRGMPSLHRSRC